MRLGNRTGTSVIPFLNDVITLAKTAFVLAQFTRLLHSQAIDASQAVLHNLLALLTNETLTPNFFNKVSNSDTDTLKSPIKVVETQGKIVDGQPNCMHTKSDASEVGAYIEDISDLPKLSDIEEEEKDK